MYSAAFSPGGSCGSPMRTGILELRFARNSLGRFAVRRSGCTSPARFQRKRVLRPKPTGTTLAPVRAASRSAPARHGSSFRWQRFFHERCATTPAGNASTACPCSSQCAACTAQLLLAAAADFPSLKTSTEKNASAISGTRERNVMPSAFTSGRISRSRARAITPSAIPVGWLAVKTTGPVDGTCARSESERIASKPITSAQLRKNPRSGGISRIFL